MTQAFLLALLGVYLVLKLASLPRLWPLRAGHPAFVISAPIYSTDSLARSQRTTAGAVRSAGGRLLVAALALTLLQLALRRWLLPLHPSLVITAYFALPIAWLWGETVGALTILLLAPSGLVPPPLHASPWTARSLGDFWRRWNTWMSSWFQEQVFRPSARHPQLAIGAVFLLSGIIHELVIDLPYALRTRTVYFGSQLGYFILQWFGVAFDHALRPGHPALRRVLCWLVVVAPAPLILNRALLQALQLWPPPG